MKYRFLLIAILFCYTVNNSFFLFLNNETDLAESSCEMSSDISDTESCCSKTENDDDCGCKEACCSSQINTSISNFSIIGSDELIKSQHRFNISEKTILYSDLTQATNSGVEKKLIKPPIAQEYI